MSESYGSIHKRLTVERGPASGQDCRCGKPATQWAYVGPRDASERFPFSTDLSLYVAMCNKCHGTFDRASVRALTRHPNDASLF